LSIANIRTLHRHKVPEAIEEATLDDDVCTFNLAVKEHNSMINSLAELSIRSPAGRDRLQRHIPNGRRTGKYGLSTAQLSEVLRVCDYRKIDLSAIIWVKFNGQAC
jgi:hypothetical protein